MIRHEMANTDNPIPPGARRILIDALNVAYWCGDPPSLRIPITLMTRLLTDGHQALLYFDASARYRLRDEAPLYEHLIRHARYVVEVPSGKTADGVILKDAKSTGACIVSRDKYRDFRKRSRKLIDDPTRLMSGWIEENLLLVPSLALKTPLASSAQEACGQLESFLDSAA